MRGDPNNEDMKLNFVPKVLIGNTYKPLYIAPDATASNRGDVWLSDAIDDNALTLDAQTGVTAATPKAVKLVNDNANDRLSKTYTGEQTVEGPVTFNGIITTKSTINGNANSANSATKLQNKRKITIKTSDKSECQVSQNFDGQADISFNITSIDAAAVNVGTLPLKVIPQGAIEKLVHVDNEAQRFTLTKEKVQNGDSVLQDDTQVMYIVVDEDNLNNSTGYKEYKAGIALKALQAKTAESADTATTANQVQHAVTFNITDNNGAQTPVTFNGSNAVEIPINNTTPKVMVGATQQQPGNSGLVPAPTANDYNKFLCGNGTWQIAGEVTGVKGNAEDNYRVGNVNITPANIGALALTGGTVSGNIINAQTKTGSTKIRPAITVKNNTTNKAVSLAVGTDGDTYGLYDESQSRWMAYCDADNNLIFNGKAKSANTATTAISATTATKVDKTLELDGSVQGTASLNTLNTTTLITQIKDKAVTSAKLGDDVGTVSVSSTQPTDEHVKIWVQV